MAEQKSAPRRKARDTSRAPELSWWALVLSETPAIVGIATTAFFLVFGPSLLDTLDSDLLAAVLFVWLFGAMLLGSFGVVRHADAVAEKLGEPYGTLVLTFSAITIEVALFASIMLHGQNNPTLARDAMFATLMIVLNGMVGTALVMGAMRYWEQEYNLAGARAYLVLIAALSVFALVLPNYTETPPDPVDAPSKAFLFMAITLLFYGVFIVVQTMRHKAFFAEPVECPAEPIHQARGHKESETSALWYHVVMLVVTLVPVVLMSESLAVIVDFGLEDLGLPAPLGGVVIALLVLAPEGLTAFYAALANHLQRAVNVCLGSALSTVGLTIPAVLAIGIVTERDVHLGLTSVETVLLVLTLFVSAFTFGGGRTNVLQGLVHLLLFAVYVMLIFSP